MIDIHCHILPNLDDGPRELADALKMAKMAEKDGIHTIIATPHCCNGVYSSRIEDINRTCGLLNGELETKKIGVKILPGAEVRLTPELIELYADGQLMTMAGSLRFLLLELPEMFIVQSVSRVIEQLQRRGVQAIIAHPERNVTILKRIDTVKALTYAGASLQITADSLTNNFGPDIARAAEVIVAMEGTHFVASDAHDTRNRRPVLSKAHKRLKKLVGNCRAEEIIYSNPQSILDSSASVAVRAGA